MLQPWSFGASFKSHSTNNRFMARPGANLTLFKLRWTVARQFSEARTNTQKEEEEEVTWA